MGLHAKPLDHSHEATVWQFVCVCVCVCVSAQEPHPHLQMKIINPSSLIFMALTNDSAAVIYWNNPATQIEQATFQPCAHAAACTKRVSIICPFRQRLSMGPGRQDGSIQIIFNIASISFLLCGGEHSITAAKQANKLFSIMCILLSGTVKV